MYNPVEQLKLDTTVRAVAKCTDHQIHAQIAPAFIHLKKQSCGFRSIQKDKRQIYNILGTI